MMAAAGQRSRAAAAVRRLSTSVGAKLFTLLFVVLLVSLGLLGYANVRLQRSHLDSTRVGAAQRISDLIRRSASYDMLRNDREALQYLVETIGGQATITGVRIVNPGGRVSFSKKREEVGRTLSPAEIPAIGTRTYLRDGERFAQTVSPIRNTPSCASGACHAHPASQEVLGLLDTEVSLAQSDLDVRDATWQFVIYSATAIFLALLASGIFVWRFVHEPVRALRGGTARLAKGELGFQIPVKSNDELGALAGRFNEMSLQLSEAQTELTAWTETLESRVAEKTRELQAAQEQMIQAEKLTSLGKLAAVVAHEINNPLSSILTYARLLRKWVERGDKLETRAVEMRDSLELIESESRRCGDIVRNLLMFARAAPFHIDDVDINRVVHQCIRLVEHKLELGGIAARLDLDPDSPRVRGDASQLEQLLLALVMNAIEAMPHDGILRITTSPKETSVVVTVEDNGVGIPPALLPRLFDPFVTTKEEGKGVGLGLAISRGIVERHHGAIEVKSEVGRGTVFTISLPAAVEVTV
jgi:two-component system NtrC family sensor kinase